MATVGKAVAVSGIAVAIGLSSLIVFDSAALRSMGIGGVVTVLSTLVFGLTVLPALLGMLGPRVNRLRVPLPRSLRLIEDDPDAADARQGHGYWGRIARVVMRHPVAIATPFLIVLILAGIPFFGIQLSTGGNLDDLPDSPSVTGFRVLEDEFPGGGADPIEVAVRYDEAIAPDGALDPAWVSELEAYEADLAEVEHVTRSRASSTRRPGWTSTAYQPAHRAARVGATGRGGRPVGLDRSVGPRGRQPARGVQHRAARLERGAGGRRRGARHARAGRRRGGPDRRPLVALARLHGQLHRVGPVCHRDRHGRDRDRPLPDVRIGLPADQGRADEPAQSITASFGALIWIFQQGNLSGLLDFEASGTIVASTPILMFAILFGLSMDYEVLLLSRIRERYLATGDNTRAVAEGIGVTGGIITGAALIMVAVFGAFALSSVVVIKSLGFAMALAVLIDATIVRGILVPAFMRVMGSLNWWAPRWMQRGVARLGLYEGAPEPPAPEPAAA